MTEENQKPSALRRMNEQWLRTRAVDHNAPVVLVSDDSEADIYFLLRAFEKSRVQNPIFVARSGQETLDYLSGVKKFSDRATYPPPKIIFLDLYMPVVNGFDVLRWKANHTDYKGALCVALSNSDRLRDINYAYELGASTFLSKPLDRGEVTNLLEAYQDYWSTQNDAAETELDRERGSGFGSL